MGGARKRQLLLLFFVSLAPLFPSPPALCRYFLPLLRVVLSVQQQLSSFCFVGATGICSSSARMLFLQPFLYHLLASHSSEHLSFVFVFVFVFPFFSFFISFFVVWLVWLCSRTRYARISLALH